MSTVGLYSRNLDRITSIAEATGDDPAACKGPSPMTGVIAGSWSSKAEMGESGTRDDCTFLREASSNVASKYWKQSQCCVVRDR